MQFTVLIEFLVPGLATTLLLLALLPAGAIPPAPPGMPSGETATALLLLAVSYPVGILVNFPIFLIQRKLLTPRIHRAIMRSYEERRINLAKLGSKVLGGEFTFSTPGELRELFGLLRAFVVSRNIDRLNALILFYEGLQRFARGMLLPLALAAFLVFRNHAPGWLTVFFALLFFLGVSGALLKYSIQTEEEQVARFFVALAPREAVPDSVPITANPALQPTAEAAAEGQTRWPS